MPQLEQIDTYVSQIFWLLVTFGILYVIMSRVLIPRMVSILEARVFQIESDQRRAEEARMDADEFGGRIAYMVSTAQIDGDRLRADVVLQERAKTEKRLAELEQEIDTRIASSEARLLSEHERSLGMAESSIAEVVDQVLSRILGERSRPQAGELRELVRDAIVALPQAGQNRAPAEETPAIEGEAAASQQGYASSGASDFAKNVEVSPEISVTRSSDGGDGDGSRDGDDKQAGS